MATLAMRLNELAAANGQGLLDDDEYRILRQDAFQRYAGLGDTDGSSGGIVFVEPSIAQSNRSTSSMTMTSAQPRPKKLNRRPSESKMNIFASTSSDKGRTSTSNNVISSFIRRATSPLRSSESPPGPSIFPSISKKNTQESALSRSSSRKNLNSGHSHSYMHSIPDPHLLSPPTSPTRPVHAPSQRTATKVSSSPAKISSSPFKSSTQTSLSAMSNHDIFEDGGLFTSADIGRAISDLDEDAKNVLRAFDELEESAYKRTKSRAHSSRSHSAAPPSSFSLNLLSAPALQHRSRSDSAATATVSGRSAASTDESLSRSGHPRLRSQSTTSMTRLDSPHKFNSNLGTPHSTSSQTPTLHRKGSVSSLASSIFSLKPKASMPSLPSLPSIQSISTMPHITRSRSGSVASSTTSSNPSNSFFSSSGKSVEGMPSMSTEWSSFGQGRSSTSTGASSIHTTTSTSSTGRTSLSSGHGHATAPSVTAPPVHRSRSASEFSSSSSSVQFRGNSTSSGRAGPSGHYKYRSGERERGRRKGDQDRLDELDELDELGEIHQIQQRKRDVIGRYDARREYLKARLRGAELHEKVKGR
ncbi:hypothetical protein F5876DRAFT_81607 [Lentinula aff. lateritia]|uniref:Uncharacterized protein n=1 Tax=Lentinula aff. lateritia TaxID=2804960 RepID=A0ACC1TLH0_9AGAR|nr:hypothetical protein F5876DRAFT_81607 [Lentinula aff. lateritia]